MSETTANKTAILLVNLGSPDNTDVPSVRRYLDEFLMDKHVIDVPWPIRALIVKGFILPTRPARSAEAYQTIWWDEGSPLIVISKRVQQKLQQRLNAPVELAMRYGNPSIEYGMLQLMKHQPERILVVALYPHYAMASTKSVVEKTKEVIRKHNIGVQVDFFPPFYNEKNYIAALTESIRPYSQEEFDHFLFSYHGLPERQVKKMDPTGSHCLRSENCCDLASPAHAFCYRHQVRETTRLVAEQLHIPKEKYSISFQSRLGRDKWLDPSTDFILPKLAAQGVKRLAVVCPAFVSDCLETLEEIGMRAKEDFIAAGGEHFEMIPCLNENEAWIQTLKTYCDKYITQNSTELERVA